MGNQLFWEWARNYALSFEGVVIHSSLLGALPRNVWQLKQLSMEGRLMRNTSSLLMRQEFLCIEFAPRLVYRRKVWRRQPTNFAHCSKNLVAKASKQCTLTTLQSFLFQLVVTMASTA